MEKTQYWTKEKIQWLDVASFGLLLGLSIYAFVFYFIDQLIMSHNYSHIEYFLVLFFFIPIFLIISGILIKNIFYKFSALIFAFLMLFSPYWSVNFLMLFPTQWWINIGYSISGCFLGVDRFNCLVNIGNWFYVVIFLVWGLIIIGWIYSFKSFGKRYAEVE